MNFYNGLNFALASQFFWNCWLKLPLTARFFICLAILGGLLALIGNPRPSDLIFVIVAFVLGGIGPFCEKFEMFAGYMEEDYHSALRLWFFLLTIAVIFSCSGLSRLLLN